MKWFFGVLFAPAACGAVFAAARVLGDVAAHTHHTLPFVLGFIGYVLVRIYLSRSVRLYVLGHELSHALAAWMSGAKVLSFFVSKKGGHVDLSHSNAFIALAPYVFPFYAMVVILGYRVFLWLRPMSGSQSVLAHGLFLALVGAAFSFHLLHTIEALWGRHQPDLDQAGGVVFSLVLIIFLNCLVLIFSLKCLFPSVVSMDKEFATIWQFSTFFWKQAVHWRAK